MYYYVLYISINRERGKQEEFLNTIDKGETPLAAWHIDLLRPWYVCQRALDIF